eukprot:6549201-Pyramimonas_sp.AAC.1
MGQEEAAEGTCFSSYEVTGTPSILSLFTSSGVRPHFGRSSVRGLCMGVEVTRSECRSMAR